MKKIIYLILFGLFLFTNTCIAQKNKYIKTSAYEGVICSKFDPPSNERAWKPYSPSDLEISKMEKKISYSIRILLIDFVKKYGDFRGSNEIINNIQNYKRQYYGYWQGGERKIIVYFYKSVPENWKEDNLLGIKGGFLKFLIEYSIDHDSLYNFSAVHLPED
ncbi:MAG: hypothetical protein HXX14_09295 [Bacteroidetes bacterium]|nr:hypothetical protein [Bacteroidota bacterium]